MRGSGGRHRRILRQAVVELDPIHLLGNPDVLSRRKGVAVVEGGQRHTRGGAVLAPAEQARAARLAEHAFQRLRRGIARGFTLDRQRGLREKRAGKERRSHRLLAFAAVAGAHIDRLALAPEPHRAAQATTFPDHDDLATSPCCLSVIARSSCDEAIQLLPYRSKSWIASLRSQ